MAIAAEPAAIETVLTGGDDFEIVATVAPDRFEAFRRDAAAVGVAITRIGTVEPGQGVRFRTADGSVLCVSAAVL